MAGDAGLTVSNQYDLQKMTARFEQRGKTFRAQGRSLRQIEWRSALEPPGELLLREARAADSLVIGRRRSGDDADPGVIVLRAGRPVLLVPDTAAALPLRRVVVAWKDTRECRRAVRDALPFLQQAKEVLIVEIGEHELQSSEKKNLADVAAYLVRHRVIVAAEIWHRPRRPIAAELLHVAEEEKADLIVAGGYGHSRLGNGFSAASPTSFWRQAPFVACCRIELRIMSDHGLIRTTMSRPTIRPVRSPIVPCSRISYRRRRRSPPLRQMRRGIAELYPSDMPFLAQLPRRFNRHNLEGVGRTLMTAD